MIMKNAWTIINDIREALVIDLNYVFHVLSNEKLNFFSTKEKSEITVKCPVFKGIFNFYKGMFKSFFEFKYFKNKNITNSKILFYYDSTNNYDVVFPIKKIAKFSSLISFKKNKEKYLQKTYVYLISLHFFPIVLFRYLFAKGGIKKVYKHRFQYFWLAFGYYIYLKNKLRRLNSHILVIPNDHEYKARVLRLVAKNLNITTVYIQHASISPYFPPLDFEYAFLDGMDALRKYSAIGKSKTKVFLTGSAKYDEWFNSRNQSKKLSRIGVCTNSIDSLDKTYNLISTLKKKHPQILFSIRPHPGDKRQNAWRVLAEKLNIEINNSKKNNTYSYLQNQDAIIACESNIHLEAAILNVIPIYFNLQITEIYSDVYGFSENGLLYDCSESIERVGQILTELSLEKPDISKKVRAYIETANTSHEGKSTKLMAKLLEEISNNSVDFSIWERCNSVSNIEAYKLKG